MDKDRLPPIPTPVSQRWREFRIQVLPFIVFAIVVASIAYLWRDYVRPVGAVGIAEVTSVNVTSLQDGLIDEIYVQEFQTVTKGQVLGIVRKTDPDLVQARMASLQAGLGVMRRRLEVDEARTEQNYQAAFADLLQLKLEQATERIKLIQDSNDVVRLERTPDSRSEAQFEMAKARYEMTAIGIQYRETSISNQTEVLSKVRSSEKPPEFDPIDAAIAAEQKELELELDPIRLKAPIDGVITRITRLPGERMLRGETILTVSAPETHRIVGYIRQPIGRIPTTNDLVEISTHSQPRKTGRGEVLRIGAQMQAITPGLLSPDAQRVEVGLTVLVSIPPSLTLVPGEYVNLSFIEGDE